eukprot:4109938-Prymnesium_polylepis.2
MAAAPDGASNLNVTRTEPSPRAVIGCNAPTGAAKAVGGDARTLRSGAAGAGGGDGCTRSAAAAAAAVVAAEAAPSTRAAVPSSLSSRRAMCWRSSMNGVANLDAIASADGLAAASTAGRSAVRRSCDARRDSTPCTWFECAACSAVACWVCNCPWTRRAAASDSRDAFISITSASMARERRSARWADIHAPADVSSRATPISTAMMVAERLGADREKGGSGCLLHSKKPEKEGSRTIVVSFFTTTISGSLAEP